MRKKKTGGFTLIELVVATGILVLLLVGFTTFLVTVLGQFRTGRVREELIAQGQRALLAMVHETREATRIYKLTSVLDSDAGQLSLETGVNADVDDERTYVDFYVDNGVLYRKAEGQNPQALTSEHVTVTAFRVTQQCPSFQVLLTLDSVVSTRAPAETLRTTAVPRFQSDCALTQTIPFSYAAHSGPVGTGDVELFNSAVIDGDAVSISDLEVNSGTTVTRNGYWAGARTGSGGTIGGTACQISSPGCPLTEYPDFSPIDFAFWQDMAERGGTQTGPITLFDETQTMGPLKVEGDLELNGDSELILTGPLWITDDLDIHDTSRIRLDPSFGSLGTVVLVDDRILFTDNARVEGSGGSPSGFVLFVSRNNGADATTIEMRHTSNGEYALLYGYNFVALNDASQAVAAIGREVEVHQTARLNYLLSETLLKSAEFAGQL